MMKRNLIWSGLLALGVGAAWAYQAGTKLYISGSLASSSVIERNGVAYVPLKDVAANLKLPLSKSARGWEIGQAGGANMVEGINGKVGDVLFNGFYRFQVIKLYRGKEYTNQFSGDSQKVTPYPEGMDLVVLTCRIKNGTKAKETIFLPNGELSGLTDDKERSMAPRSGLSADIPTRGAELLPGAAVDFALTFDVPADAKLKDLVYQVYSTNLNGAKKTFRVSLVESN